MVPCFMAARALPDPYLEAVFGSKSFCCFFLAALADNARFCNVFHHIPRVYTRSIHIGYIKFSEPGERKIYKETMQNCMEKGDLSIEVLKSAYQMFKKETESRSEILPLIKKAARYDIN